jgi:hypothetical protein
LPGHAGTFGTARHSGCARSGLTSVVSCQCTQSVQARTTLLQSRNARINKRDAEQRKVCRSFTFLHSGRHADFKELPHKRCVRATPAEGCRVYARPCMSSRAADAPDESICWRSRQTSEPLRSSRCVACCHQNLSRCFVVRVSGPGSLDSRVQDRSKALNRAALLRNSLRCCGRCFQPRRAAT